MTRPNSPHSPNAPVPGPHLTTITVDGAAVETLADLPPLRDRLLFVGLNPSPVSVEAGHYHQGRLGQTFWRRLMLAGVIPPGTPISDRRRCARRRRPRHHRPAQGPDAARHRDRCPLTSGVGPLWQKIAIWRPAAVVFIYKRAAETAAGRPLEEPWGALLGVALAGRPCVLMPGPYAPVEQVDEGINFLRNLGGALPVDRA